MTWNWHSYSRECLLYWLGWHLVVQASSLTVKKPNFGLLYYLSWMWRLIGTCRWSCSSVPTDYVNSLASGLKPQNTAITGHSAQHRMSGLLLSMAWMFCGHSCTGPCGFSKWHTVTLHYVFSVYNDMFDHMDGVMRALAKKKTQSKEDLYFTVKVARQRLSKYYAEVTPTTGLLLISAHILDPFRKLPLFRKWEKLTDMNPEDETSYTTQYDEAFLKYVENKYCTKHQQMSITKPENDQHSNFFSSAKASGFGQSSFHPYDLSSDDDEYLTSKCVAVTTPGWSDRATHLLTTARLYLNSPPESPKNWGQENPNVNDYHSHPKEISSTFWLPDITDWLRQQKETHSKYADLPYVAHDIFSIIPHGVGVEASFSLGQDIIGWNHWWNTEGKSRS